MMAVPVAESKPRCSSVHVKPNTPAFFTPAFLLITAGASLLVLLLLGAVVLISDRSQTVSETERAGRNDVDAGSQSPPSREPALKDRQERIAAAGDDGREQLATDKRALVEATGAKPLEQRGSPAQKANEPGLREREATFLGTRSRGERFCIIADNSGSMVGAPLNHVKQELLKTLTELKEGTKFYVIFFNHREVPMPFESWLDAGKLNVDKVAPWIQGIRAAGGTQPLPAFTKAMNLNPRPDVIFFMTDGLIPNNVPAQVAAINDHQPKVVIHTIMFAHMRMSLLSNPRFTKLSALQKAKVMQNLDKLAPATSLKKIGSSESSVWRL